MPKPRPTEKTPYLPALLFVTLLAVARQLMTYYGHEETERVEYIRHLPSINEQGAVLCTTRRTRVRL